MKLLVQPGDGISDLVKAIDSAKRSVEILIFRFNRTDIERALENAAKRGVLVHALIAYTNRGGEPSLRKLETHLLAAGVTVARTSDDLARYHGKMMIIDRRALFLLAFNFTNLDIEHSRSFAVITKNTKLVQEAGKLFEADTKRQPYTAGSAAFVVSPVNARKAISAFIKSARKELLIYDPKISDPTIIRLLEERAKAGVEVRIIGKYTHKSSAIKVCSPPIRLHTRTIVRDQQQVFIGSQGLRKLELDGRREIGIIFRDAKVVSRLTKTFEHDWSPSGPPKDQPGIEQPEPAGKTAKKVAKAFAKDMPSMAPALKQVFEDVMGDAKAVKLNAAEVEETVKSAVKEAIKEVVKDALLEAQMQGEAAEVQK